MGSPSLLYLMILSSPYFVESKKHLHVRDEAVFEKPPTVFPIRPNTPLDAQGPQVVHERPVLYQELGFRALQKRCDGQCFYYPPGCNRQEIDCKIVATISKHNGDCNGGYNASESLGPLICNETARLYTFTLARHIKQHACGPYMGYLGLHKIRACSEPEFIALSMYTKQAEINDNDVWYVCAYNGATIENWTNVTRENPMRIVETSPFHNTSIGLVDFYSIVDIFAPNSLICQFTLNTNVIADNLKILPDSIKNNVVNLGDYIPEEGAGGPPLKLKIAIGKYTVSTNADSSFVQVPMIQENSEDPFSETDFVAFQEPVDFEGLELGTIEDIRPEELDEQAWRTINITVNQCFRGRAVCYEYIGSSGCSWTGTCPLLVILGFAEDDDVLKRKYEKFHVSVLSYNANPDSTKHPIQPDGWIAVGFSYDTKMGDDFIVICSMRNQTTDMAVVFSHERSLIYDPESPAQKLVTNRTVVSSLDDNYLFCSFTIPTKLVVDMTPYKEMDINVLNFTFDETGPERTYIIYAMGRHVKPGWNVSYHDLKDFVTDPITPAGFYNTAIIQNRRGVFISKEENQKPNTGLIMSLIIIFFVMALFMPSGDEIEDDLFY